MKLIRTTLCLLALCTFVIGCGGDDTAPADEGGAAAETDTGSDSADAGSDSE